MAFTIRKRESIGDGLARLFAADVAAARRELADPAMPRAERVHSVRQRLKRLRALLHTLEPLDAAGIGQRCRMLRDAARVLAVSRDAVVVAETVGLLHRKVPDSVRPAVGRAAESLAAEAERTHSESGAEAHADGLIARAADGALPGTPAERAGAFDRTVRKAMKLVRRRGRAARESRGDEALHSWRKAVKQATHLLDLGRHHLKGAGGRRRRAGARLGELLGADHDLAVAAEQLATMLEGDPALPRLQESIAKRRADMQKRAFRLGKRFRAGSKPRLPRRDRA